MALHCAEFQAFYMETTLIKLRWETPRFSFTWCMPSISRPISCLNTSMFCKAYTIAAFAMEGYDWDLIFLHKDLRSSWSRKIKLILKYQWKKLQSDQCSSEISYKQTRSLSVECHKPHGTENEWLRCALYWCHVYFCC